MQTLPQPTADIRRLSEFRDQAFALIAVYIKQHTSRARYRGFVGLKKDLAALQRELWFEGADIDRELVRLEYFGGQVFVTLERYISCWVPNEERPVYRRLAKDLCQLETKLREEFPALARSA